MRQRSMWMAGAVAAALLMFVAGYGIGGREAGRSEVKKMKTQGSEAAAPVAEAPAGTQYALFLFENESYRPAEGEAALRDRIGEYSNWARSIAESGRFITGEKLADDGRWCRMEAGTLAVAGPVSDSERGVLAGYFIMGAASYDEAEKLAATCPHIKYGGSVEIRRIEGT